MTGTTSGKPLSVKKMRKENERMLRRENQWIKAAGACGLLYACSGTQSGKLLGGKLANKISQFSMMPLANIEHWRKLFRYNVIL